MDTSKIIKGDDLMLFVNDKAIAFATSHTITLTSSVIEAQPKIGTSNWSTGIHGLSSWECTTENLYSIKINNEDSQYDLLPLFINGTTVDLKFTIPSNSNTKSSNISLFSTYSETTNNTTYYPKVTTTPDPILNMYRSVAPTDTTTTPDTSTTTPDTTNLKDYSIGIKYELAEGEKLYIKINNTERGPFTGTHTNDYYYVDAVSSSSEHNSLQIYVKTNNVEIPFYATIYGGENFYLYDNISTSIDDFNNGSIYYIKSTSIYNNTTTTPEPTTPDPRITTTTVAPIDMPNFKPNNNPGGIRMLSGKAIITNYSVNANSGDIATMSVTFKGISPITIS